MQVKKDAPVPVYWDESGKNRFVVPPKFKTQGVSFGLLWYGEGAVGVSAPAQPLSFIRAERNAFSGAFLSVDRGSEYCCGITAVYFRNDCMRFLSKCQAIGRLEAGLYMQRQSRSPRESAMTSASAVPMLLAKGMLFLSHRREI